MVSAHDVAAYILGKQGPLSAMKLQKLVYYSQAWSTVWDDKPLFPERIEAWAKGPVVRELYDLHRGQFDVRSWPQGDPAALNDEQRSTVDAVLGYYGWRNAQALSDMTHAEEPWRTAREGVPDGVRGNREITLASMSEYYSSLPQDEGEMVEAPALDAEPGLFARGSLRADASRSSVIRGRHPLTLSRTEA